MRRDVSTALTPLVALALLAALAGPGCVPSAVSGEAEVPVTVVTGKRGLTTNPYSPRLADRRVGRLLFRGLLVTGPDGQPSPDLAVEVPTKANGGIRDGGRTVVYRIRPGVKWHDGKPLTARDVVFTIKAIASGRITDDPAEDFSRITDVESVDDQTVKVTFSRPDSVMAWRLAPYVVPEHLLGSSRDMLSDPYWTRPVGSGPYEITASSPDGTLELAPRASGPALVVRPFATEAESMREFNEADSAVWLDAVGDPAGAAESLSTTYGPVWRSLVFDHGPQSQWSDGRLRAGFKAMATATIPADIPASAYPFGVRPPSRTVPDTRTAAAAFESAGFVMDPRRGVRMKDGKRLDLIIGVNSIRPEVERSLTAATRVWGSAGLNAAVVAVTLPIKPSWTEGGSVARGEKDAYLMPFPAGRPFGWAFPFARGDEPSWERPWGLNIARYSDDRIQAAFEAARTASDPATARARIADAGRRIYAENLQIEFGPMPERVLYKGVSGVQAWPSPDEALAQAVTWRSLVSGSGETTPAAAR